MVDHRLASTILFLISVWEMVVVLFKLAAPLTRYVTLVSPCEEARVTAPTYINIGGGKSVCVHSAL